MDLSSNACCGVFQWRVHSTDTLFCSGKRRRFERVVVEHRNYGGRTARLWLCQDLCCTRMAWHRQRDRCIKRSYTNGLGRRSSSWSCCWTREGNQSRGIHCRVMRLRCRVRSRIMYLYLSIGRAVFRNIQWSVPYASRNFFSSDE